MTIDASPGPSSRAQARAAREAQKEFDQLLEAATVETSPKKQPKKKQRRKTTVTGVLGEILITIGVATLLYVIWQLWVGDLIYEQVRFDEADQTVQTWKQEYEAREPAEGGSEDIPVLPEPVDGVVFASMQVPRWGAEYNVNIAGGVSRERTLDEIGIGSYPGAAMPGQVGNFSLAAHRTTFGKPFNRMADLKVNDAIVITSPEGWYVYRFRNLQYVVPTQVDVLSSVPQVEAGAPGGKYITLTSCSPMYSLAERIVGYGVFESFTPLSEPAPAALTEGL